MKTDRQTLHPNSLLPHWILWPSRLLLVAALIFISQQMLISTPMAASLSVWDKLAHFSAWALVVILGYSSCRSQQHFIIAAVSIFVYSTFIEILQSLVAERFFSFGDILANSLGCLAAMLLIPRADRWLCQKRHYFNDQCNKN